MPHKHIVFLNTFSEIASDSWLEKLFLAMRDPLVGIAGATGSYESLRTSMKQFNKGVWVFNHWLSIAPHQLRRLIRMIGKLFPKRFKSRIATKVIFFFARSAKAPDLVRSLEDKFEDYWRSETGNGGTYEYLDAVPAFPNPHIRTNAFIVERKVFLQALPSAIEDKEACYLFESGPNSLTRHILRLGRKAVVVGADGKAYDLDQWADSGTFRLADQFHILVRDNQTCAFDRMSEREKQFFTQLTWGGERSQE